MIFRALDGICRADEPDSVKLAKISRIVAVMKDFESYAEMRRAGDEGPVEDERQLVREFALSRSVDTRPVDDRRLYDSTVAGVRWLVKQTQGDGGWGWPRPNRPTSANRSLPWDTAIVALALRDWLEFFRLRTRDGAFGGRDEIASAVAGGRHWLIEHQNRSDGGWSRSGIDGEPSHAVDTGTVLWLFNSDGDGVDREVVRRALAFFDTLEHPNGGTKDHAGSTPDVKATALSIIVRLANGHPIETIERNIGWLVGESRTSDPWFSPPEGQVIDPAFYAMAALLQYMWQTNDRSVLPAIQATVNGYLDRVRYVSDDRAKSRGSGWAWGDVANTAAAISALLNSGESSASASVQMGLRWLLTQRGDDCWGSQTAIVTIALTRYLKPGSRMSARLQAIAKLRLAAQRLATVSGMDGGAWKLPATPSA